MTPGLAVPDKRLRSFSTNAVHDKNGGLHHTHSNEETVSLLRDVPARRVRSEKLKKDLLRGCANGFVNVVESCLENLNVNVNCQTRYGMTPLHYASLNGNLEIVELLLKKGADFNLVNSRGLTPSHFAKLNGHEEVENVLNKAAKDGNCQVHGEDDSNEENQETTGRRPNSFYGEKNLLQANTAQLVTLSRAHSAADVRSYSSRTWRSLSTNSNSSAEADITNFSSLPASPFVQRQEISVFCSSDLQVTVTDPQKSNVWWDRHVTYSVNIRTSNGLEEHVRKRFTDFRLLHRKMMECKLDQNAHSILETMRPYKVYFKSYKDPAVLSLRMHLFQVLLTYALSHANLNPLVVSFVVQDNNNIDNNNNNGSGNNNKSALQTRSLRHNMNNSNQGLGRSSTDILQYYHVNEFTYDRNNSNNNPDNNHSGYTNSATVSSNDGNDSAYEGSDNNNNNNNNNNSFDFGYNSISQSNTDNNNDNNDKNNNDNFSSNSNSNSSGSSSNKNSTSFNAMSRGFPRKMKSPNIITITSTSSGSLSE